nr:N-6 DNA methylase [uncultured Carboxylicivirga sp.]
MTQELKYGLEQLDMIVDDNHTSGLIPVVGYLNNNNLSPEEIIALENANKYGVTYVYFRKFENRPSVAQIYLYDYTDKIGVEETELTHLHKQLYSSGQVPMFFVFTKRDVRIFNCFERPAEGKELKYSPLTIIKLAAETSKLIDCENQQKFKEFSGKAFDNGTFWENSVYSSQFKFSNSAYEKLLTELKQALKDIIEQDILPAKFARKIMVVSILIKYLEEREDENGNRVFPDDFFSKFVTKAEKFTDILSTVGAYLKLLDFLAQHFNGGIFHLDDTEREYIKDADLTRFGHFLDGDLDNMQFVFWRLYSFNDLPVELISNIYEEFLGKQPGVVYTPPYLVNFLLDEAMPINDEKTDFKILDPSCGSGVFLVGAYRRLIYRWRKKNSWKRPNLPTLKKLLKENIFGVELNKDAANLTVFSLSLALCDELTPLQIWKDLKFDNLHEENILHDDFFNVISGNRLNNSFDLIIGNPPFEAKLTPAAKDIEIKRSRTRKLTKLLKNGETKELPVSLPDNQVALLFLEQSIEFCKKGGLVCLIQPSGPLLYNNSSFEFRQNLLQKYNVPQIIDFTHISRILFGKNGDVATAAAFIKNEESKNKALLHVTVRRTKPHKEKLYFELDSYDFHTVPYHLALNDVLIWKSNFLGGSRVHQLMNKYTSTRTLGEYLGYKKKNDNWIIGEGFKTGKSTEIEELVALNKQDEFNLSNEERERLDFLNKKFIKASFLTGKNTLLPKGLKDSGIDDAMIEKLENEYFLRDWVKKPEIFEPPHLLLGEVAGKYSIPIDYTDEYLSFTSQIIGIHTSNKEELLEISNRLKNNKFYLFYLAGISGRYMVNKSTSLLKGDIDKLPFPTKNLIEFSEYENIIINDVVDYLIEFKQKGENSTILTEAASKQNLIEFGEIYCGILKQVFKTINSYSYFETDRYICYPFYFGNRPTIDFSNTSDAELYINELVQKQYGVNLRIIRNIRVYEGNVIYLIKPKKLRYWLKSIALRDADETFSDLRKQGY